MPKPIEVDGPEFMLEDLDDIFLWELDKLRGNVGDLRGDFNLYDFLLRSASLGPRLLGLTLVDGYRRGAGWSDSEL